MGGGRRRKLFKQDGYKKKFKKYNKRKKGKQGG